MGNSGFCCRHERPRDVGAVRRQLGQPDAGVSRAIHGGGGQPHLREDAHFRVPQQEGPLRRDDRQQGKETSAARWNATSRPASVFQVHAVRRVRSRDSDAAGDIHKSSSTTDEDISLRNPRVNDDTLRQNAATIENEMIEYEGGATRNLGATRSQGLVQPFQFFVCSVEEIRVEMYSLLNAYIFETLGGEMELRVRPLTLFWLPVFRKRVVDGSAQAATDT